MRLIFYVFLIASATIGYADVRRANEQEIAEELAVCLGIYNRHVSKSALESWEQMSSVDPGLLGLNAMMPAGNVTETFSIVPLHERHLFPLGNIIIVQSKAMKWPDTWKTKDPENPGKYFVHPKHQDIRFFVYEKDGKFIADRWYETKFQAMLAETGLTIPPPTPYYPPRPIPPGEKPAASPEVPVIAAETAPAVAHATVPTPAPAPVAPPPAKSPNPLWWVAGAVAALIAAVLVVRRKKPKA